MEKEQTAIVSPAMLCNHQNGQFSVTLELSNIHASMDTYGYSGGRPPYRNAVKVSLFNMDSQSMYELADSILLVANQARAIESDSHKES